MLRPWDRRTISHDSRGGRRLRSFALLRYTISKDQAQKSVLVNARDVAANGASFVTNAKIPLNAVLETELYLPPLKDPISVMANVVRISRLKNSEQYLVGVRFSAIDPTERSKISAYIERVAKDASMRPYLDKKAKYFRRNV